MPEFRNENEMLPDLDENTGKEKLELEEKENEQEQE